MVVLFLVILLIFGKLFFPSVHQFV
jgi:hypothetical protein